MKLLLDTHIWIWSVADRERLSPRILKAILESSNELWVSPVSAWELLVLHSLGRIQLAPHWRDWIARATVNVREAALTQKIVMAAYELSLETKDPADRFLAATAQVLGLTLVTADRMLLGLGNIATLVNN